ncbi:DUF3102 domain-containing protein [Camelimonas lactis]|uniref:DUF3102 domain-containing protein n=1 Tax=Camelimonas lactis TaxID=659006 RepID=UPI003630B17E
MVSDSTVDADKAASARAAAERIRVRMARAAEDIFLVGRELTEQKQSLGHGQFLKWLRIEFDMSEWTARNFMNVYGTFNKSGTVPDLPPTALYALAAPSTPEPVRAQVLERAASGEKVTASAWISQNKPAGWRGRATGAPWAAGAKVCPLGWHTYRGWCVRP